MKKKNELRVNTENELVDVENIYQDIRNKIMDAREKMFKHIDSTMTEVYWYVGKITYELSENSTKAVWKKDYVVSSSVTSYQMVGSTLS